MMILERDKERGGGISSAICRRQETPSQPKIIRPLSAFGGQGRLNLADCFVAPPRSTAEGTSSSSRLAFVQIQRFQNSYNLCEHQ